MVKLQWRYFNLINNIRQNIQSMGQQETKSPYVTSRNNFLEEKSRVKPNKILEHEGILKLRTIPFKNCAQISFGSETFFLENINTTVAQLLQARLFTNKLFPEEDIEKLIESVVYALAFLQQNGIYYRDLSVQNMFYNGGNFKILPNELIQMSVYQLAQDQLKTMRQANQTESPEQFFILSPELIIALRCQQPQVTDMDILHKSNVFIFGMILLEITTLLPSSECYDHQNYDILDSTITQRLALVEEHYNPTIARVIANMLDYDYTERMDLKQLSIWINRELCEKDTKVEKKLQNSRQFGKGNSNISKGILAKSNIINSKVEKNLENSKIIPSRTNQVYLNSEEMSATNRQLRKNQIQKNQIYLRQSYLYDKNQQWKIKPSYVHRDQTQTHNNYQNHLNNDLITNNKSSNKMNKVSETYVRNNPTNQTYLRNNQLSQPQARKSTYKYYPCLQELEQIQENKRETQILKKELRNEQNLNKYDLSEPKVHLRKEKSELNLSKDIKSYSRNNQIPKENLPTDHSINRIKEEIQKSRKLIQQFQKSEGIPLSKY